MKKILIVDDLRPFVEREKSILNRQDFELFTALSGDEALGLHKAHKMDLIITDLDMPRMSGDQLCSLIKKDPTLKKVSIIMVCTRKQDDLEKCLRCGADGYITKPIKKQELIEKVNHCLNIPFRKDFRVLIKVSVKGRFGAEPFFCISRDISKSGILIETEKVLARGDIISCSFFIPDEERIIVDGEVMRVVKEKASYQYGVMFLNLEPEYEKAIGRYVERISSA